MISIDYPTDGVHSRVHNAFSLMERFVLPREGWSYFKNENLMLFQDNRLSPVMPSFSSRWEPVLRVYPRPVLGVRLHTK